MSYKQGYSGKNDKPNPFQTYGPGQQQRNSVKIVDTEEREVVAIDFERIGMNTIHPKDRTMIHEAVGCNIKNVIGEICKGKEVTSEALVGYDWYDITVSANLKAFGTEITGTEPLDDVSINFGGAFHIFDMIFKPKSQKDPENKFTSISTFEVTMDLDVTSDGDNKLVIPVIPSFLDVSFLHGESHADDNTFGTRKVTCLNGKAIILGRGVLPLESEYVDENDPITNPVTITNLSNGKDQEVIGTFCNYFAGREQAGSLGDEYWIPSMPQYSDCKAMGGGVSNVIITDEEQLDAKTLMMYSGLAYSSLYYNIKAFVKDNIADGTNSLTITFEAIPINQFAVEDQMNSQDDNTEAQHTYNGSQLYAIIPVAVVVDDVDIAITDEIKIAKQYLPRTAFDFCTGTPTNPKEYFDLDGIDIDEWKEQIFTSVHYKHLYNDDGYYLDLFTGINSSDKYMWFGFSNIYGVYSPMNVPLVMPFTSDTNYPDISISTIKRIDKADDLRLAEYLIIFTLDGGTTNNVMYLSRATTGYISPVIYSKCFQLSDFVIVENFLFSIGSNGYLDEVISDNPITKLHFHNNSVLENNEINLLYVDTSTTPYEFVQVKNGIVGDGVTDGRVQDIGYYDDKYDTDLADNIVMDIIVNSCQVDPLQTTMPNARTSQVQTFIGSSLYQFIKTSVYSLVMSYGRHALRFIPFSLINAHTEKNGAVSEYLTTQVIPIIYPILYTHKSSNAMAGLSVDAQTHSGAHFFDPSKWFDDRDSQYFFARTISSFFNMHSQPYLLMPADDTYKSMVSSPESNAFEIILEGASTPYQAFYRAFAGSMLVTTTQDLNNVGTPESVLYTKDAINVEFIRNKILYGKNQIIFNNLPAIESKKGLYSASTLYQLTSDTSNRISDIPFGTYTVFFTIAQYTIVSDGYSTFVYMTDNNGTYCIGKVEGQCIYKPSICELGIVFSTLDSTTIRIFQITGTDIVPIKKIDESGAVAHQAFIPSIGDIVICTNLASEKNYIKIYKLSKYGIVQLVASSSELANVDAISVLEFTSGAMIIFHKTIDEEEYQYVLITASTESEYELESSEFYFPYEQGLRMVLMGIKLQFEDENGNPEGASQKTFDLTVTANGHTEVYSDTDIACGTEVVIKWNSVPVGSARYKIENSSGILRNIKWLVYPLPLINETL